MSPFRSDLDDADYFYGFGYDELSDDYLLVSICCAFEAAEFPYTLSCDQHKVGLFFNGCIHWLGFRVMERKHVEMPFPDGFEFEPEYCDLMENLLVYGLWILLIVELKYG